MACCAKREKVEEEEDSEQRHFGAGLFHALLSGPLPPSAEKKLEVYKAEGEEESEEQEAARSAMALSRHIAATGASPNLLLYMCSDPPPATPVASNGSSATSPSAPKKPRAFHIPGNTPRGVPIATEHFEGEALVMYRPASVPEGSPMPDAHPYARYFDSRKRNWEFRVQGRFKKIPTGEMFMGVVLRDFNYDQAVAGYSKMVKNTGLALVKYDCYLSWGDRCEASRKPDAELSHMVTDLTAWDQVIITPEGKAAPSLTGQLHELGNEFGQNLMRKEMGVAEFARAVKEACKDMNTCDTFTCCFWGVSQVVDCLNWQFKFGGTWATFSMGRFFEDSPIHIAMYELEPPAEGDDSKRQLESRKRYYLDFMFWSNTVRCPKLADKYVFVDAPEELESFAADLCGASGVADDMVACASFHTAEGGRRSTRSLADLDTQAPESKSFSRAWSGFLSSWRDRLRWIPKSTCSLGASGSVTTRRLQSTPAMEPRSA